MRKRNLSFFSLISDYYRDCTRNKNVSGNKVSCFIFISKKFMKKFSCLLLQQWDCVTYFSTFIRYNVKKVKAIVRSLYNSILHLSSVKADSVEQSYTAPETRDDDSVSGSKNTENANATKKYAYLILQILLFSQLWMLQQQLLC